MLTRLRFLGVLAAFAAGCTVSPQPSPPWEPPPDPIDPPAFDDDRVGLGVSPEGEGLLQTLVTIVGGPGTVDPPDGVVILTNLETDDAPSIAAVTPDGGFEIVIAAQPGNVIRFQARTDEARSEPVDLLLDGASFVPAMTDFNCLVIEPAIWLELDGEGDARSLVFRNDCQEPLTFVAPRLRRGNAGLTFSPTAPFSLDPGVSSTLTVHAVSGDTEDEDVLYLEIDSPTAGRRPVTITR